MMKKLFVFLAIFMLSSSVARADIVLSDDFSTPGPLVGSTPDVGGPWTQTGASVVSPLTINGSNQLAMVSTGQDAFAAFSAPVPTTAGTILNATFTLNVSAVQGAGDYFFHFMDPAASSTTSFYNRIFARPGVGAGTFQLGVIGTSGGTATPTYGTDLLLNQSYAISSDWNFVAGVLNDTFSIGVDGASYIANAVWGGTNAEPASQVSAANFRQGGATTGATLTVDNLVVNGATAAIPEPSSLILLSGAVGLVGLMRRRK